MIRKDSVRWGPPARELIETEALGQWKPMICPSLALVKHPWVKLSMTTEPGPRSRHSGSPIQQNKINSITHAPRLLDIPTGDLPHTLCTTAPWIWAEMRKHDVIQILRDQQSQQELTTLIVVLHSNITLEAHICTHKRFFLTVNSKKIQNETP